MRLNAGLNELFYYWMILTVICSKRLNYKKTKKKSTILNNLYISRYALSMTISYLLILYTTSNQRHFRLLFRLHPVNRISLLKCSQNSWTLINCKKQTWSSSISIDFIHIVFYLPWICNNCYYINKTEIIFLYLIYS